MNSTSVYLSVLLSMTLLIKADAINQGNEMNNSHTVVVVLEAKEGQEATVKKALMDVVEPSRQESACVEYRLHQDKNNPAQFVLYENWKSEEAHAKQFEKPYIVDLGQKLEGMLAKPYQVILAQEV